MSGFSGHRSVAAAMVFVALLGFRAEAQGIAAKGSVVVPMTVALKSITTPQVVSRDQNLTEVTADLVVGANARFDVIVRPMSGFEALARQGIRTCVVASGACVPVDGSTSIALVRLERGDGRLSRVVYRFERPASAEIRNVDLDVEYDAVVSSGAGIEYHVLATQRISAAIAPSAAGSASAGRPGA